MTHDELLAKFDEPNPVTGYATQVATELARKKEDYLYTAIQKLGINPDVVIEQNALITQLKAQIRAIVELHKQRGDLCETCFHRYPCATIQSITEQLSPLSKSQIRRITKVQSDELREKELK